MVRLITGSSRGLGKSIALALGERGHSVAVHYRDDQEAAEKAASRIKDSIIVRADVRDPEDVQFCVKSVMKIWGRYLILIPELFN